MSKRTCTIEDCGKPAYCRGWCQKHYTRFQRHGDPGSRKLIFGDDIARLMEKVSVSPSGCWVWTGSVSAKGYGQFRLHGRTRIAHRAAFMLIRGPIPDTLDLDHLCRNRACVNPDHLEPVSHHENLLRGSGFAAVNAAKTHCVHDHAFTPENTYVTPTGGRGCKTCRKAIRARHT